MTRTPREVFLALVEGICEGRFDDVVRLYADRTHIEHPFHPLGVPPLRSRAELQEHFRPGAAAPLPRRRPVGITVHETTDPEVIVAEFAYEWVDQQITVPCVFVLRVRDGEIVASRDYIDHLASARARGMLDDVLTELRSAAAG